MSKLKLYKTTQIRVVEKNGVITISNSDGIVLREGGLSRESALIAMIYQSIMSRLDHWSLPNGDLEFTLTFEGVLK